MGLKDRLRGDPKLPEPPRRAKRTFPSGWEPRVTTDGEVGEVCTQPMGQGADEKQLIEAVGLNPEEWRIDGRVLTNRWQQHAGSDEWLYQYKFHVLSAANFVDDGWNDVIARIAKHKPRRPKKRPVKHARVYCLSDWQAGKPEGGGTDALAARIEHFIDEATAQVKAEKPDVVYLMGMGDMVEGCDGHYAMQTYLVDMNRRQQERFVRRAIISIVQALAPHVPRIVLGCVPGNHGENRKDGKAYTSFGDNADVAAFEAAMDALEMAPAYDHVSYVIPDEDLTVTLDIAGTTVAFAHGHQFSKGATPQQKALNWWKGQAMGRHPAGEADCLVSAHFHHWQVYATHGRLWLQCPALDGGSEWFKNQTGEWSLPGTLTFRVASEGIRDVALIQPPSEEEE